ncbi:hypothetical protein RI129_007927 [Pyrocoelia pectoralis]|uniref:Dynein heavy chain n=1 Tax=Pyrocoelia pectoralis TaxID=417401 RepID=A0AAN7VAK0_9COLE
MSIVGTFSPPQQEDVNSIYSLYLPAIIKQQNAIAKHWSSNKIMKMVTMMITVYNEVHNQFNLIESHYDFSLNELTKWCKGILMYKGDDKDALRLFQDRLVDENHRIQFEDILRDQLKMQWNKGNLLQDCKEHVFVPAPKFVASPQASLLGKQSVEEWIALVKKGVTQYEREGDALDVLVIPELGQLTAKVAKALVEPGGNVLLIGVAGVGRKPSVKIISALLSVKFVAPIFSNCSQFNNDLKMAIHHAAVEGEDTFLLLEDSTLNDKKIIDTVKSLAACLKDEASRENYEGTLTDFFSERIKKRLHMVICIESNNSKFSELLTNCPALYTHCNVIWTSEWSKDTLESIPKMLIESANKSNINKPNVDLVKGFFELHGTISHNIAIPSRFISFVKTYIEIFSDKVNIISKRQSKLQAGVTKLTDAKNVVDELKLKAKEQQEKLSQKQEKANAALDMISSTMKNANTQKHEMENLKQHTEKESVYLAKRKKEIEEELSEVKPLIEAARTAVGNIKAESLSEIRSLRAPPDVIRDILEGVLRLMGTQDTSWNSMKNFLSKRGVKEDIRSFDASRITVENRDAVSRLLANRKDSFDPKNAKRASVAAAPLAAWVTANVRYSSVLENIKPLEKEQNKLKHNLAAAEMQLNELSSGLTDVDATVAKLKNQLSTYTKEAAEIEINLNAAQETLNSAEGLINKLNDEYERWKIQLKEFSDELHQLPTNCLLASAFITYLSQESEDNRILILEKWLQVLGVNKFSLEEFLSSEREQLQWQSEGLPADQLSLQNAIIILNMNMTPLFLDPSSIASDWIKTHLKSKTVEVISQDSPKFSTVFELAVRFGKALIIEEIETISPTLLPILRKQFVDQVDYHSDFKLILSCRNSKLQLPADLAAVVNVVNFTTTHAGLSEQLLMSAIKQDSPELETRRKELLRQREELQEKQYNLQNQLLEDLANASGDILQNKNLMVSLNETKASSSAIATALIESEGLHQKLQEEYNVYKDVSSFSSALYFAIEEFSTTNVLYSLSVPAFIRLFLKSLPQLKDADQSFGFLERSLIQAVYSYMSRAIFKADRLKFALHLCHKILPREIPNDEWNFFLGNSLVGKTDKAQSVPEWVPESLARNVGVLQSALPSLYGRLQLEKESAWRGFFERNDCEANFPAHCDLSEFQKVIVVQVLRRNRLYSAMRQCAQRLMSLQSLNPEIILFSSIYNETFVGEPILLVTAPGTDPSVEIRELAFDKMDKDQYVEIAMGEGQESKTLAALAEAATQGHWLVLKNLHLVTSWLPILCQNMKSVELHNSFRLWLITEPHPMFSSVLARSSLKIAYEVPQGIKNNILRTYTSWGASYVEKLNPTGSRLFFILSCIHALLQERRTYIPQGWSKAYEFNDTDFSTAIRLTVELMQSPNVQIQWNYLTGVCSDSVYGGRIENIQDLGILDSYLSQNFVDEALTHRWRPLGMANSLPSYSNFQDYLNAINQLSDRDLPSYFGLPANIQQAWEKTTSSEIISHLRNLNFDKRISLNQAQDFIRIPTPSPIIQKSLMENFISEEYCYAVIVVKKIHKSFSILNKLAKGGVLIDAKYFEVANELLLYQTPKIWQKLWKGPQEPTKYLKTVMYKTSKIAAWKESSLETVFERPINLSSLFHPATFLSVFKQDFARRKNIAMDDLMLKTSWRHVMGDGIITITNLLIEGALFEGSNITDCLDNSDSINMAPDCHLSWITKGSKSEEEKAIKIPLYDTNNREDILAYLEVANNFKENNKWIQAGVAFYITF